MTTIRYPDSGLGMGVRHGLIAGFATAVGYGVVYGVYAFLRQTANSLAASPDGFGWQTAFASSISFVVVAIVFVVVAGLAAALLGALTAVLLRVLLRRFNPGLAPGRALAIGTIVPALIGLAITLAAGAMPGSRMTLAYPETYLFWIGVPGAIYVVVGALVSRSLNALWAQAQAN